jgi:hypothetical protein
MDEAGIVSIHHLSKRKKPKDQRVLHPQRIVFMSSPACITLYIEHKSAKDQEKSVREAKIKTLATYRMGLEAYQRYVAQLSEKEQVKEAKLLRKGKERVLELLTSWEEQGDDVCPWLLG